MAEVTNVGAYYFSDNAALYEPQRSNTFQFVVTNLDSLLKPGALGNATSDYITNGQEVLTFSVVTANIPNYTIAPVEIRRGNSVMKVAGLPTFEDGSITIRDFIGADGLSVLQSWQRLAYNPDTQLTGKMTKYKKDCYLIQYDVDYSKVVRQWLMKGCWVSSIQQDALNVENGDARTVTATISFDSARAMGSDEE